MSLEPPPLAAFPPPQGPANQELEAFLEKLKTQQSGPIALRDLSFQIIAREIDDPWIVVDLSPTKKLTLGDLGSALMGGDPFDPIPQPAGFRLIDRFRAIQFNGLVFRLEPEKEILWIIPQSDAKLSFATQVRKNSAGQWDLVLGARFCLSKVAPERVSTILREDLGIPDEQTFAVSAREVASCLEQVHEFLYTNNAKALRATDAFWTVDKTQIESPSALCRRLNISPLALVQQNNGLDDVKFDYDGTQVTIAQLIKELKIPSLEGSVRTAAQLMDSLLGLRLGPSESSLELEDGRQTKVPASMTLRRLFDRYSFNLSDCKAESVEQLPVEKDQTIDDQIKTRDGESLRDLFSRLSGKPSLEALRGLDRILHGFALVSGALVIPGARIVAGTDYQQLAKEFEVPLWLIQAANKGRSASDSLLPGTPVAKGVSLTAEIDLAKGTDFLEKFKLKGKARLTGAFGLNSFSLSAAVESPIHLSEDRLKLPQVAVKVDSEGASCGGCGELTVRNNKLQVSASVDYRNGSLQVGAALTAPADLTVQGTKLTIAEALFDTTLAQDFSLRARAVTTPFEIPIAKNKSAQLQGLADLTLSTSDSEGMPITGCISGKLELGDEKQPCPVEATLVFKRGGLAVTGCWESSNKPLTLSEILAFLTSGTRLKVPPSLSNPVGLKSFNIDLDTTEPAFHLRTEIEPPIDVSLGQVGGFKVAHLCLQYDKPAPLPCPPETGEAGLSGNPSPEEGRVWSCGITGGIGMNIPNHGPLSLDGTLTAQYDPGRGEVRLVYQPSDGTVKLPFPKSVPDVDLLLRFIELRYRESWSLTSYNDMTIPAFSFGDCEGVPGLPALPSPIHTRLEATPTGVGLCLAAKSSHETIVGLDSLEVGFGDKSGLAAGFHIRTGVLNALFGTDKSGAPKYRILNDSVKSTLTTTPEPSLDLKILDPPLGKSWNMNLDFTHLGIGNFGQIDLAPPCFGYEKERFQGSAGFSRKDLRFPLLFVKRALAVSKELAGVAGAIPEALPLKFDFSVSDFGRQLKDLASQIGLPPERLPKQLDEFAKLLRTKWEGLPKALRDYFPPSYRFPCDLQFSIDVKTTGGGTAFDLATTPSIRVLLPASPAAFAGIDLRCVSLGQMFGGSVLSFKIDADIDLFLVPDLIDLMQTGNRPEWADKIHTRIFLENLFMLIIYQSGVPIPVPVFYGVLGFNHLGLGGEEAGFTVKFPEPKLGLGEIVKPIAELYKYSHSDEPRHPEALKAALADLVPAWEIDACYVKLPPELGGRQFGKESGTYTTGTVKEKILGKFVSFLDVLLALSDATRQLGIAGVIEESVNPKDRLFHATGGSPLLPFGPLQFQVDAGLMTGREFNEKIGSLFPDLKKDEIDSLKVLFGNFGAPKEPQAEDIFVFGIGGSAATFADCQIQLLLQGGGSGVGTRARLLARFPGGVKVDVKGTAFFNQGIQIEGAASISSPDGDWLCVRSGIVVSEEQISFGGGFQVGKLLELKDACVRLKRDSVAVDGTWNGKTIKAALKKDGEATILPFDVGTFTAGKILTASKCRVDVTVPKGAGGTSVKFFMSDLKVFSSSFSGLQFGLSQQEQALFKGSGQDWNLPLSKKNPESKAWGSLQIWTKGVIPRFRLGTSIHIFLKEWTVGLVTIQDFTFDGSVELGYGAASFTINGRYRYYWKLGWWPSKDGCYTMKELVFDSQASYQDLTDWIKAQVQKEQSQWS